MSEPAPVLIPLPPDVVRAIETVAPDQDRTAFVVEAVQRELQRRQQIQAIREATGLWKDYPDLPNSPQELVAFMRRLRRSEARVRSRACLVDTDVLIWVLRG